MKGAEPAEASHVEATKEKKTRSKKVKEAVMEAEVEHGAETAGVCSTTRVSLSVIFL